jgi:hypothetical protein
MHVYVGVLGLVTRLTQEHISSGRATGRAPTGIHEHSVATAFLAMMAFSLEAGGRQCTPLVWLKHLSLLHPSTLRTVWCSPGPGSCCTTLQAQVQHAAAA